MKLINEFKIGKIDRRSCEDRREYSYTAYIPERRSGTDRRKGKNGKSTFWPSTSTQYKKIRSLNDRHISGFFKILKSEFSKAYLHKGIQKKY
jgi:hypothetical protein